jgi:hypothetical protein
LIEGLRTSLLPRIKINHESTLSISICCRTRTIHSWTPLIEVFNIRNSFPARPSTQGSIFVVSHTNLELNPKQQADIARPFEMGRFVQRETSGSTPRILISCSKLKSNIRAVRCRKGSLKCQDLFSSESYRVKPYHFIRSMTPWKWEEIPPLITFLDAHYSGWIKLSWSQTYHFITFLPLRNVPRSLVLHSPLRLETE